jgi:hypothetical protein
MQPHWRPTELRRASGQLLFTEAQARQSAFASPRETGETGDGTFTLKSQPLCFQSPASPQATV